jgi:hypothetical protein
MATSPNTRTLTSVIRFNVATSGTPQILSWRSIQLFGGDVTSRSYSPLRFDVEVDPYLVNDTALPTPYRAYVQFGMIEPATGEQVTHTRVIPLSTVNPTRFAVRPLTPTLKTWRASGNNTLGVLWMQFYAVGAGANIPNISGTVRSTMRVAEDGAIAIANPT